MLHTINIKSQTKKSIFQVISCVFGIGKSQTQKAIRFFGYKPSLAWKSLSNKKRTLLLDFFDFNKGIGLLKQLEERKKFLVSIYNFRGSRLRAGLPTRGQRTKTNRKTAKKLNR